jgi:hypothetical protein
MTALVSSHSVPSLSQPSTKAPAQRTASKAPRALVALLLAASVAALTVVADQLISTWADGHLLVAWVLMWAVVFAGSLLLAHPARRLAQQLMTVLDAWAQRRAKARAEARFLALARADERVMSDLRIARDRADGDAAFTADAVQSMPAITEWTPAASETVYFHHGRRYMLHYI